MMPPEVFTYNLLDGLSAYSDWSISTAFREMYCVSRSCRSIKSWGMSSRLVVRFLNLEREISFLSASLLMRLM